MTTDEIFKTKSEPRVLAYFSFEGCSVCKALRPKVEAMLADYPAIQFLYIDTKDHPATAGQFLVFAAPTIILFENGREIRRWSRNLGMGQLQSTLDRLTAKT